MSDYPVASAAGLRMMGHVPGYYETSRVFRTLSQSRGEELDRVLQAINETLDQFFVRTSSWGLDAWEKELNLPPQPGISDEERRDRIAARLRGHGTCTLSLVKQVAGAYEKGSLEAIQDHSLYRIIIKFTDTRGIPPNIESLKLALREVVPAHLGIDYTFNYLIWQELDAADINWNDLDDINMTWDQFEQWNAKGFVRSTITCTFCEP